MCVRETGLYITVYVYCRRDKVTMYVCSRSQEIRLLFCVREKQGCCDLAKHILPNNCINCTQGPCRVSMKKFKDFSRTKIIFSY